MFQQCVRVRELSEGRPGQSQTGERGEKAAEGDERGRGPGTHWEAEEAHGEQPGPRGGWGGEQQQQQQRAAETEAETCEKRPDKDALYV